jgi:hypothetical protein
MLPQQWGTYIRLYCCLSAPLFFKKHCLEGNLTALIQTEKSLSTDPGTISLEFNLRK